MKKLMKKVLPILLVCAIFFNFTCSNALALINTAGGTWDWYDITTDNNNTVILERPVKIVYLPPSQAKAVYDSLIATDQTRQEIKSLIAGGITSAVAKQILLKYSINLTPYIGIGTVFYTLLSAASSDYFNSQFKSAYNSSSSRAVRLVWYVRPTDLSMEYYKIYPWYDSSMPETITLDSSQCTGYVKIHGTISIGRYELDLIN